MNLHDAVAAANARGFVLIACKQLLQRKWMARFAEDKIDTPYLCQWGNGDTIDEAVADALTKLPAPSEEDLLS